MVTCVDRCPPFCFFKLVLTRLGVVPSLPLHISHCWLRVHSARQRQGWIVEGRRAQVCPHFLVFFCADNWEQTGRVHPSPSTAHTLLTEAIADYTVHLCRSICEWRDWPVTPIPLDNDNVLHWQQQLPMPMDRDGGCTRYTCFSINFSYIYWLPFLDSSWQGCWGGYIPYLYRFI